MTKKKREQCWTNLYRDGSTRVWLSKDGEVLLTLEYLKNTSLIFVTWGMGPNDYMFCDTDTLFRNIAQNCVDIGEL